MQELPPSKAPTSGDFRRYSSSSSTFMIENLISNFFYWRKKEDLYALANALFLPELQFSFLNFPICFFEAEDEFFGFAFDFLGLFNLFLIIF
jgi:hypothetical protein